MTEEQLKEGNAICSKVNDLKKARKSLDGLTSYIGEKETRNVEIQLHEQWISTPYAEVNKTNLIGFLNTEKARIELEIQSLKEKLQSI